MRMHVYMVGGSSKAEEITNTYGKWSRNTSGDVFTNLRCWEAEILLVFGGVLCF